jgi:CBS-domain-containing membrane protein
MNSAIERIVGLRVKDIMNENVLTVADSDEMQAAAKRIFDAEVTGAPVVNALGECVGVLSASDFVGRDAGQHDLELLTRDSPYEPYNIECLNDNLVATHMSPIVQTIADDALILAAARVMCNEGIHRLVVVDDKHHPVGIISTLDLVAAMVGAIGE